MNQEKILKRRMITALILWIITLIALLVFIGLYIDETRRVQETYRKQYKTELTHAVKEIDSYLENKGDTALRYKRITSYVTCASSYAFLIENSFDKQQKVINEVNTCMIKYPEQMSTRLEELKQAFDDIGADLDKGYEEAQAVVDSVNKKVTREWSTMNEKRKLKREIKICRQTIEEIERKRSRSQSALVQAVLLQEEPDENDVEWFNKYTGEITACRNHMIELQKKLNSL